MTDSSWAEKIKGAFGDRILAQRESAPGEIEFTVGPESFHQFLSALKTLDGGAFDHLADLTSYDEAPKSPRFHVVYELISLLRKCRCAVVVPLAGDTPSVRTITDLWQGANWLEREVFDLMGINFDGHPDLRRILLPPSFKGSPLRKDFIVDYRQIFPENVDSGEAFDPFGNNIVNVDKGVEWRINSLPKLKRNFSGSSAAIPKKMPSFCRSSIACRTRRDI